MASRYLSFLALSLSLWTQVHGFDFPAHVARSAMQKRDLSDFTQNTLLTSPLAQGLFVEVEVAGNAVPVLVDAQSSDLIISGPLQNMSGLTFAGGQAQANFSFLVPPGTVITAPIVSASVQIAGDTITQDILDDPMDALGFAGAFQGTTAQGVLGLGPSGTSLVAKQTKGALSPLDNLYLQNSKNPFSTYLVAGTAQFETDASDPTFAGFFTVGEVVQFQKFFSDVGGLNSSEFPPFGQVVNQPPITLDPMEYSFNVDTITVTSDPGGSALNTNTVFSTRTNISYVPANIVSIVLGSASSSSVDPTTGLNIVPCTTNVQMEIDIGNVKIPIDPATIIVEISPNVCVAAFAEITSMEGVPPNIGAVFGLNVLQNLYLLLGYQSVSGQTLNNPIAKILPLVDAATAQATFTASRQQAATGGSSSSASTAKAGSALEALDVQNKASDNNSSDLNLPTGSLGDKLRHCLPAIILGAILVGLFAIGFAVWAVLARRRRSGMKESAYRNIHHAETTGTSQALYGHEEDGIRYSDPYSDKL